MKNWKITGLIATLIILLTLSIYLILKFSNYQTDISYTEQAKFVGRENCIGCHKKEYDLWRGSDHDNAMDLASDSTVLGDFNNSEFSFRGITNRFYKKGNKFFVYTQGPKGEMSEFEITHTFGVKPLQQYLVPFPEGRYQCLPIAWDTDKKEWFNLSAMIHGDAEIKSDDWLYWTNQGQNWNGMCAECHSTNLHKNYDPEKETFNTTWSEIDISCEACHGAGSLHIDWANLPEMARSQENNSGLIVQTRNIESRKQVDLCAPCHSRRAAMGNNRHQNTNFLDYGIAQLITEPLYFVDGQILDENYVYGSFLQSKMYMNNVRCGNCHNVHSGKLVKEGNALCLQCHQANIYDSANHHFHKYENETGQALILKNGSKRIEVGEGAQCIKCHMPGRFYMGIDYRIDHSMRIPRPDLSEKLGTPNACNQCHTDKTIKWSKEWITKWYGLSRKPHFAEVFAPAYRADPEVLDELIDISKDVLYPPIVRATTLEILNAYSPQQTEAVGRAALKDSEPLVRNAAVRNYANYDAQDFVKNIAPLLDDPLKAVRSQAAQRLSSVSKEFRSGLNQKSYQLALQEYIDTQLYSGDFASSRHNLGILYSNLGKIEQATYHYEMAIKIDNQFYPAKVNLALIYNTLGQNDKAELLYREIIQQQPDFNEAYFSLGLLLAEVGKYDQALEYLQIAVRKMPQHIRIYYNLGLLFQYLQRFDEAESSFQKALNLDPYNLEFMNALIDHYIKSGEINPAREIAKQMISKHPENPLGKNILNYLDNLK